MSERWHVEDVVDDEGWIIEGGYTAWKCEATKPARFGRIELTKCGNEVRRYRGQSDVDCHECGQPYNAAGQRLRSDYRSNRSMYDDEVSDMDGYEDSFAGEDY